MERRVLHGIFQCLELLFERVDLVLDPPLAKQEEGRGEGEIACHAVCDVADADDDNGVEQDGTDVVDHPEQRVQGGVHQDGVPVDAQEVGAGAVHASCQADVYEVEPPDVVVVLVGGPGADDERCV